MSQIVDLVRFSMSVPPIPKIFFVGSQHSLYGQTKSFSSKTKKNEIATAAHAASRYACRVVVEACSHLRII